MNKIKTNKATLVKVLKYLKPHFPLIAVTIVLSVAVVLLSLYLPRLTGQAVDLIKHADEVDFFTELLKILIKMLEVIVLTAALQWVLSKCNNTVTYRVIRDLRRDAFNRIQKLPLSYLDTKAHGELVSRVINDVEQFADGLLIGFTQLFTGVVTIIGTLFFMLRVNLIVTAVVVLVTPVSLFVAAFIAKHTHDMFKVQSETKGEQTALINETVGNIKTVIAYNREGERLERFDEINRKLQKCSLRAIFYSSLVNPSTRFVNSLVYAGVGLAGGLGAINGALTVGELTCLLSYANQYTKPFNEISGVVTELQNAFVCIERVFEIIEKEPETAEKTRRLEDVKGSVDLKNVYFSYVPERKLIEDLNLSVKPGRKIAIVGPTGCGKTTVINLLMRFYDVNSGSVNVDGFDVRDVTRKSLRQSYGMVLQDIWLKHDTVRNNLLFANPDATEEEMIAAAKAAHAHSFIKRLPKGYDTVLSENGGGLSEGQKQLLCIARVMLKLPPMLILDEATSSIDTRTEHKIQDAFSRMMNGRTSFIVAHRLSTIQNADVILVMKDGHVLEQGRHEDLLANKGFYYTLYNSRNAV
ncbi:MAG: ABC transporter ATP-binding protein [Lachnospiraceae bacterium]|nr:ABC transporter ATP-binding protein [Lachnospiraceae bacterium]